MKYEPITIKEPYKEEIKTFNTTDEFNIYYREHEAEFKGLSSMKLNRTFKIPGYRIRITKKGTDEEEMILVKDYYKRTTPNEESDDKHEEDMKIEELKKRIDKLEQVVKYLNDSITNINEYLGQER